MGGIPSSSIIARLWKSTSHDAPTSRQLERTSHFFQSSSHPVLSPKSSFFHNNSKILTSKSRGVIHPELRLLRTILGCDYGRPKFIQFMIRQTPILQLYQNITDERRFYQHFLSKYLRSSTHSSPYSSPSKTSSKVNSIKSSSDIADYDKYFILLCALSWYQCYMSSQEHLEWIQYQYMIKESQHDSSYQSNSIRSISEYSSHQLARELQSLDYGKLLSKSHWVVALANALDEIPYPATILEKDKLNVLFANSAYVELVGHTREEITQFPHDKYHSADGDKSETDPAITYSVNNGTTLKIGIMYHPQAPLPPFLNLQSYLPLYDPEGHCNYILVLHCDIWRHHYNSDYLQKLDILTDILSKAIIPQREYAGVFLKAYFYNSSYGKITELSILH